MKLVGNLPSQKTHLQLYNRERASAILAVDVSFSGTNDMSFFIFFIGGINDYDYLPVSFYWPLKFYSILAREKKNSNATFICLDI